MIIAPYNAVVSGTVTCPGIQTLDQWFTEGLPTESSFNLWATEVTPIANAAEALIKGEVVIAGQSYPGWTVPAGTYVVATKLVLNGIPRGAIAKINSSLAAALKGIIVPEISYQPGSAGTIQFVMTVTNDDTQFTDRDVLAELSFVQYDIPQKYTERDIAADRQYSPSQTFA